jgi:uncharacterized protein (DUF2384 family)
MTASFDECRKELVLTARRLAAESGDSAGFDAAAWVDCWLKTPVPALGGRCPQALAETAEGAALLLTLLHQMQTSAYA